MVINPNLNSKLGYNIWTQSLQEDSANKSIK